MTRDQLGIEIYKTPLYKSAVNGQERFHSTLSDFMTNQSTIIITVFIQQLISDH